MKRFGVVIALFGAVAASSPASAADPASGSAPAAQPSARALELANRLLVATGADRRAEAMSAQILPAVMNAIPNGDKVPTEFRQAMMEASQESMAAMRPALLEKSAAINAAVYSEDELEAMVGFYESPMGQRILAKAELAAGPTSKLIQEMMPSMMQDMQSRLCVKMKLPKTCEMSDVLMTSMKEGRQ